MSTRTTIASRRRPLSFIPFRLLYFFCSFLDPLSFIYPWCWSDIFHLFPSMTFYQSEQHNLLLLMSSTSLSTPYAFQLNIDRAVADHGVSYGKNLSLSCFSWWIIELVLVVMAQ